MSEVVDLPLRELGDGLVAPGGLELPGEVIGQVAEQPLGLLPGLLGDRAGLARNELRLPRAHER